MRKETCKVCMKNFEVHNSRPPVTYCSVACKRLDFKTWHPSKDIDTSYSIRSCDACGKQFNRYGFSRKQKSYYCTKICMNSKVHLWNKKDRFIWSSATLEEKTNRLRDIFERSVVKSEGCWDWKGVAHHSGYCHMNYDGKSMSINRISWELNFGEIPNGLFVLHKCDNRRCSNPDHLFLGSSKDNHKDMMNKGRQNIPFGENHKNSKLTSDNVKKIKELLQLGVTMSRISKDFKISMGSINAIKHRRTWKHVN